MALDCYNLTDLNCKELLFQIEECELDEINDILLEFKKLTGVFFDTYGNTRLHQDFVEIISTRIRESLFYTNNKNSRLIRQKLLANFGAVKGGLWMVGD